MEIRPIETVSMVYYVMAQHLGLVLLLRETKSPYLRDMFEYVWNNNKGVAKIMKRGDFPWFLFMMIINQILGRAMKEK
jgi:hypothetical protein